MSLRVAETRHRKSKKQLICRSNLSKQLSILAVFLPVLLVLSVLRQVIPRGALVMSIRFVSGKHTETIEKRQLEKRRRRVVVAEPRAILRPQQPEERARLTPKALVLRSHAEVGRLDNVKNPHPSISKECTLHDTFRQHKISHQIIKLSWFQVKDRKKACSKINGRLQKLRYP